jgi:Pyridoxamine 5'-phosphate oxidase
VASLPATKGKLMGVTLSADSKVLIDRPNFVHLATIMPDGSPHSARVWVVRDGDLILIGTEEGSVKAKNTRREPRVSVSIERYLKQPSQHAPAAQM